MQNCDIFSSEEYFYSTCPFTGSNVICHNDWEDVLFGEDYWMTIRIVADNIITVRIKGWPSIENVIEATDFTKRVIDSHCKVKDSIIYIGDFCEVTSINKDVRTYYIEYLKTIPQLHSFILCTQSSWMAIACKLGKKFDIVRFNFYHHKEYASALKTAQKLSSDSSWGSIKNRNKSEQNERTIPKDLKRHITTVVKKENWFYEHLNFSSEIELINGDIIHRKTTGSIDIAHVKTVNQLQKKIIKACRLDENPFYVINNVEHLSGSSLKARKKYAQLISSWAKEHPHLSLIVMYGANRLLRTGLNLATYSKPISVVFAPDLKEALRIIKKHKLDKITPPESKKPKLTFRRKRDVEVYAEELNQCLCNIDWEREGHLGVLAEKDESHPFKSVYDAMVLIKSDIDELFQDRAVAQRQIHELTQELIKAQENERRRIARDLHDNVAQDLASLIISSDTLFDGQEEIPTSIKERSRVFAAILRKTIASIRDLVYDLRPPGLAQMGLVKTVDQYCEDFSLKSGIDVDLYTAGLERLHPDTDTKINLFRILQEGLNNVRKHAQAATVKVRLIASYPDLILRIEDNGIGFHVEERSASAVREKRMGLKSMEERVNLLNGEINLRSRKGRGTKIVVKFPCHTFIKDEPHWGDAEIA